MPLAKSSNPEAEVRSWGFKHVFTWSDSPHAHYSPHKHAGLTTHLISSGTFTVLLPEVEGAEKVTYGKGDRVDVKAGEVHEVWIGAEGCRYVIGE